MDPITEPRVSTTDDPHFAAVVEFPNGVVVMVCDASTDDDTFENVVVTTFQTTTERVLVLARTVRPDEAIEAHELSH